MNDDGETKIIEREMNKTKQDNNKKNKRKRKRNGEQEIGRIRHREQV